MDSKKDETTTDITSFNQGVPEANQLVDLDEEELKRVAGGGCGVNCGVNIRQQNAAEEPQGE
ncbi:hypothetical protein [Chondromyces apiculatus]|uniref:Uncharacterized protein n=1 Tax=Chondromyces apiculatus DSM 436 TaxID=1192034 RepID=A0A017T2P4_9BACT|nr:hypothetical protein [Chondromyces apiculatus]EYF03090.1 Hypothetical protein CAP_6204 [Chondromyces apiculatus DSM 436]